MSGEVRLLSDNSKHSPVYAVAESRLQNQYNHLFKEINQGKAGEMVNGRGPDRHIIHLI
jgi:hypothetical protein